MLFRAPVAAMVTGWVQIAYGQLSSGDSCGVTLSVRYQLLVGGCSSNTCLRTQNYCFEGVHWPRSRMLFRALGEEANFGGGAYLKFPSFSQLGASYCSFTALTLKWVHSRYGAGRARFTVRVKVCTSVFFSFLFRFFWFPISVHLPHRVVKRCG